MSRVFASRLRAAAPSQRAPAVKEEVTIETIIKAFEEDSKYKDFKQLALSDTDEAAQFVAKCEAMCRLFNKSLDQWFSEYDAFKFGHKIKSRVLSLSDMDRLSAQMKEAADSDMRKAQKAGLARPRGAPAALMRPSQASQRTMHDKGSLAAVLGAEADMDDMFGGGGEDAPSSPVVGVKRERISPLTVEDDADAADAAARQQQGEEAEEEEESKTGDRPRKRAHVGDDADGDATMDGSSSSPDATAASSSSATPGASLPASKLTRLSFPLLNDGSGVRMSALYPNALGKFVTRNNAGERVAGLNEEQLARLEASSSEPSEEEMAELAKRIVEVEVFQSEEGLDDEDAMAAAASAAAAAAAASAAAAAAASSSIAAKAAKYRRSNVTSKSKRPANGGIDGSVFRYMYQNEEEVREALDAHTRECLEIMMEKPEVEDMRILVKPVPGAAKGAASLANSLVSKPATPASDAVVVKKEGDAAAASTSATPSSTDETMKDAATPATAPTPAGTVDSSATAAATPASAATAASNAAAAAAPIVLNDDDDDESAGNIVPLVPVGASKAQSSVLLTGRVVYDTNDVASDNQNNEQVQKLSATHSVWIEGDRALSSGARIQMRLNGLRQYALFPGQVVIARGINASGLSFVAEDIFTDASLPHAAMARQKVAELNASLGFRPLGLMAAAGPYTTTDDLSYAPLFALLTEVHRVRPDVLLLTGPFLDSDHKDLADNFSTVAGSYASLFVRLLSDIMTHLRSLPRIKVLVQPSTRDLAALTIFPQPAFDLVAAGASPDLLRDVSSGRLVLLPNPCLFRLNDLTVGVSSMDIVSHLGAQNEIHKAPPTPSPAALLGAKAHELPQGRLQRLASHLLSSHSFYPLFPAPDGVHLDYSHAAALRMHVTPDILILPSKTRYFASAVTVGSSAAPPPSAAAHSNPSSADSPSTSAHPTPKQPTIVVNPEYLTKGPSGGTYALVSIHPLRDEEMVPQTGAGDRLRDHAILSRTRVDILRI